MGPIWISLLSRRMNLLRFPSQIDASCRCFPPTIHPFCFSHQTIQVRLGTASQEVKGQTTLLFISMDSDWLWASSGGAWTFGCPTMQRPTDLVHMWVEIGSAAAWLTAPSLHLGAFWMKRSWYTNTDFHGGGLAGLGAGACRLSSIRGERCGTKVLHPDSEPLLKPVSTFGAG